MASFSLRCPTCRTKFKWEDPTKGMPEYCPNPECATRIAHDRADDDIVMPSLKSMRSASHDQVYREMEKASEHRAEQAALQSGADISEMAGLKITDLRPTRREGDIAAQPLPAHLQNLGSFSGGQGAEYASSVQSGPEPNAGARMRTALQAAHGRLTGGAAVSDVPALETQQPGYRRRG